MLAQDSDKEWEKFGRNDPYYGVLSHDRFRRDKLNEESFGDFFKSGEDYINFLLETIRTSLVPEFSPSRALDFGCGVGRCSIPLARVCQSVVGVDVSESMLEEARRVCSNQEVSNLQLVKSDDALSHVLGPFDLVHSFLVFQHIPQRRGERIFMRLIELLCDNGVGAVQFVYDPAVTRMMGALRKKVPLWHNFVNLLYGKPFSEPLMEKNVYDLNCFLSIMHQNGCGNAAIRFYGKGKLRSVILFFQKKQDNVSHNAYAEF